MELYLSHAPPGVIPVTRVLALHGKGGDTDQRVGMCPLCSLRPQTESTGLCQGMNLDHLTPKALSTSANAATPGVSNSLGGKGHIPVSVIVLRPGHKVGTPTHKDQGGGESALYIENFSLL